MVLPAITCCSDSTSNKSSPHACMTIRRTDRKAVLIPLACRRALYFLLLLLGVAVQRPGFAAEPAHGFKLQDFIGRHWRNEAVRFNLAPEQLKNALAKRALIGPDNQQIAYQLVHAEAASGPAIEFAVDLQPFETRMYRFISAAAVAPTDLYIEDSTEAIRLTNKRVGISIRKRPAHGQGPIAGIRLSSGQWIGDSVLNTPRQISSYSAEIVARGPVFAEVLCRITFAGGKQWQLRIRLQAHEPVMLVDESFSSGDSSSFVLVLSRNFAADGLLYRHGSGTVGQLATYKIGAADGKTPIFVLEPWLHWWERQRQGTWFGLYSDKEPGLLAIGARDADTWVDPKERADLRASAQLPLSLVQGELRWTLPLVGGARRWMIGAFDRDASLAALKQKNLQVAPLPQQYFTKHGTFPLERVKRYVSQWAGDEQVGPRLMVTQADLSKWRSTFKVDPARLAQLTQALIPEHKMDEPIGYYLATGDRALGKHLATTAASRLQGAVDMFLRQDSHPSLGFAPHQQSSILTAINLADAVWSTEHVSPQMRERFKAQVAFLAYTVNREDYWSPARGFGANPNMTTTVAAFQAILACMIPAHPLARTWLEKGMRELKNNQLDNWADDNGGWLEAPHYAIVSYDYLLGAFLAARNAGFNEYLHDPTMKKVIEWLAKISTPPDSLSNSRRHIPPIGNTYMREPSGLFGTVAYLWRQRDPAFAAEMQWMYRQHGAYPEPVIGGFLPSLAGYRSVLLDRALPEKAPAYGSEWFPRTGVVLRNHFPSRRETQLHLIAGTNHEHYDRDSGSFTLWGKGRLIANDFGYHGRAPGDEHNMVVSPRAEDSAVMHVTQFLRGNDVDYVRGRKADAWDRQIVFVKDSDPLGPNYFVFRDTIGDSPSIWRTWFTAGNVAQARHGATVEGKEDVYTDVFFASDEAVSPTTQEATRTTWGLIADNYGQVSTRQIGLAVAFKVQASLTTIMYPRLKTEQKPVFTAIANGKGVKIETAAGTDYVFLSTEPFTFADAAIKFEGSVGAVLVRGERVQLWLGQTGSIAAYGKVLHHADGVNVMSSPVVSLDIDAHARPHSRTFSNPSKYRNCCAAPKGGPLLHSAPPRASPR